MTGIELAQRLYDDHLGAVISVPHSAALLGWGSDVLGFDDVRSRDHGFGPRLQLFVAAEHVAAVADAVEAALPDEIDGYPTRFGWDDVPVAHHVLVADLQAWSVGRLGFDATAEPTVFDWLVTPQQRLLEVVAGPVFHDDGDRLAALRANLAWYPHDVWLYLLAAQWRRIAQDEAFPGRTAERGDELGSRLVTARLVRDLVRLCFLQERRYAAYAKWLGSAFARLAAGREVGPALDAALAASAWPEREDALVAAYEAVARRHNELGLTEHVAPEVRAYFTRPFRVIGGDRFAAACVAAIDDDRLRTMPLTGSIDQVTDTTDVLTPLRREQFAALLSPQREAQSPPRPRTRRGTASV